jgi:hypothetical protein
MNAFVFIVLWMFFPIDGVGRPEESIKFCPKTKIVNTSGLPWVENDQKTLEHSKKRCGQIYFDSPCVKVFEKYNFQAYRVICGEKK